MNFEMLLGSQKSFIYQITTSQTFVIMSILMAHFKCDILAIDSEIESAFNGYPTNANKDAHIVLQCSFAYVNSWVCISRDFLSKY